MLRDAQVLFWDHNKVKVVVMLIFLNDLVVCEHVQLACGGWTYICLVIGIVRIVGRGFTIAEGWSSTIGLVEGSCLPERLETLLSLERLFTWESLVEGCPKVARGWLLIRKGIKMFKGVHSRSLRSLWWATAVFKWRFCIRALWLQRTFKWCLDDSHVEDLSPS